MISFMTIKPVLSVDTNEYMDNKVQDQLQQ